MKILSICLFLIYGSVALAASPTSLPTDFRPDKLQLATEFEYFKSDENYDVDGDKRDNILGGEYMSTQLDIMASYSLEGGYLVGAGGRIGYATSDGAVEDRSNSEFNQISLFARKLFAFPSARIIPELKFDFAINSIDEDNQEDVITSDGTNNYLVGAWVIGSAWRMKPYAYGGFQYRDNGFSSLGYWKIGTFMRFSPITISAEIGGFRSITEDENTDDENTLINEESKRTVVSNTVNGGSLRYYAVNPDLTEFRASIGFNMGRELAASIGMGVPLEGSNTAVGYPIFATFSWNMDFGSPTNSKSAKIRKSTRKKKSGDAPSLDEDFEPDLEEVEQGLFQDEY